MRRNGTTSDSPLLSIRLIDPGPSREENTDELDGESRDSNGVEAQSYLHCCPSNLHGRRGGRQSSAQQR